MAGTSPAMTRYLTTAKQLYRRVALALRRKKEVN